MAWVDFRDGGKNIPEYIEVLMDGFDTLNLTYQQAIDLVNSRMLGEQMQQSQQRIVRDHFMQQVRHGRRN